ncbi:uncharacterized protein PAF06_020103 [Gastrophryne carolinensis]
MSSGRSDTSSKRKKSTPQKFKSRKLFTTSGNDFLEPEFSRARDVEDQEGQLELSILPVTLQNKENLPEECPNGSETPRGRGRPKGSKNKTFPTAAKRVYDVRETKPALDSIKCESDGDQEPPTPHRGRGRPKGSTKVKRVEDLGPKRARGRPKGSKNKKPSKATLLQMLSSGQKIGRGRPRKTPLADESPLIPKRGRGRPKGSLNKVPSTKRLTKLPGPDSVKRKRGRPTKHWVNKTVQPLTPKRPRGRPSIKTLFPETVSELPPLSETNEVKRKRGRPRKFPLRTELIPLGPKRPRGRPRSHVELPPPPVSEEKSSESNTDDENNSDDNSDDLEDK